MSSPTQTVKHNANSGPTADWIQKPCLFDQFKVIRNLIRIVASDQNHRAIWQNVNIIARSQWNIFKLEH